MSTDRQDQPENDGYELVLPFIATQSHGGPYEDQAFVAGYQAGQIDRSLAAGAAVGAQRFTFIVYSDLATQLDLIGMRHGYNAVTVPSDGVPELSTVTFTAAMAGTDV